MSECIYVYDFFFYTNAVNMFTVLVVIANIFCTLH